MHKIHVMTSHGANASHAAPFVHPLKHIWRLCDRMKLMARATGSARIQVDPRQICFRRDICSERDGYAPGNDIPVRPMRISAFHYGLLRRIDPGRRNRVPSNGALHVKSRALCFCHLLMHILTCHNASRN
jgi:hypothetical protein